MDAVGGSIILTKNGVRLRAKGTFTYNLGAPLRKPVMGHHGQEGFTVSPQEAFAEGELTDAKTFSLESDLYNMTSENVVIELANGKTLFFQDAYYSGTGNVQTEEGNINFRISCKQGREI